jgi:hypothetical protein
VERRLESARTAARSRPYRPFDLVPAPSSDDFTQDELGEFPARWRLSVGTFEVAEMSGERWLRCTSDDGH